jgi:UDP-2,3-diacylglucosamine pyrophosphatase LpxH
MQNDVIQKLLRKARKGTKVIYVPGNHDEVLRDYLDLHFGVHVVGEAMHCTRRRAPATVPARWRPVR